MITVAFVHVGADAALPRIMVASVRRAMPAARIVHLTDELTAPIAGTDETIRRRYDGSFLMTFRLAHFAALAPCNAVFLDTDVMVQRDLSPLFDWEFDVALTARDGSVIDPGGEDISLDMPYDIGVMLSKPSGWEFWREAERHCARLSEDHRRWGGDQHAVKAVADTAPLCILDLECRLYNHTPHTETEDVAGRYVVHYKGARKAWMAARGLREFGGPPTVAHGAYSRANPSARYVELQRLYKAMHEEGERYLNVPAAETFAGTSLPPLAGRIRKLIERTGSSTLLDYGSGKGKQYQAPFEDETGRSWPGIAAFWGVGSIECYDPGYAPYSRIPEGTFDAVISTDVLEHCPEEDLPWILDEIFGYARRFVFTNVACYPAAKRLPNGENAHCTVKPAAWWRELIGTIAARHPGVLWETWLDVPVQTPAGVEWARQRAGNT